MQISNTLILLLLLVSMASVGQDVDRIEPPNWWTGMKDQNLQILLHDPEIGASKPHIKYKGIKLIEHYSPGSPNYLVLNIQIAKNCKPGDIPITLTHNTLSKNTIYYPLIEREVGSDLREGFNTTDAIYLITPDRFANGDPENDKVEGMLEGINRNEKFGRHGGDLQGIGQHLDYIASMGFTSMWINPVVENNMPSSSYHGYAITDFYQTDPRFGSNELFKTLCHEAKAHGMKIIKDMVTNHIGLHHPWMNDPPSPDWINRLNQPFIQTNHRKTIPSDPYAAETDKEELITGWFVPTMPDLNVTNKDLAKYLIQNAIWWIEYAGLGGIRMDTYLYPEEEFMSEWAGAIMKEYPAFNIVGEVWKEDPATLAYWQDDKSYPNNYDSNLRTLCDFPLREAIVKSLTAPDIWEGTWTYLYETLAHDYLYPDPHNMVVFGDNHDIDRLYSQLGEDFQKWKLAIAFLLTTRGIPQIYYGSEILMTNLEPNNHGEIRKDFPGGWEGDEKNAFSGKGLSEIQLEAKSYLQKLLIWRKSAHAIHHGRMLHYAPKENVYVYFRQHENQRVMVLLNKNNSETTVQIQRFKEGLGNASSGNEILTGKNIDLSGQVLRIGPGPTIIELR